MEFVTVNGFVQKLESCGETVDDLEEWLIAHRDDVTERLDLHGAILLRGFGVDSADDFQRLGLAINPNLYDRYPGGAPRSKQAERVWNASETPPHMPIPSHCEMSYLPPIRPKQIMFCCLEDRHAGGETPVARMDAVYNSLPPRLQDRHELEVVRYYPLSSRRCADVRRVKAACMPWPGVLGTKDKMRVVADAQKDGVTVTWWSSGAPPLVQKVCGLLPASLSSKVIKACNALPIPLSDMASEQESESAGVRLASVVPLTSDKRYSGIDVFFSEWGWLVESFFIMRRTKKLRDLLVFSVIFAFTVVFGILRFLGLLGAPSLDLRYIKADGTSSSVPLRDIVAVDKAYWENFIFHKWQKGDVVILNNNLASHGRMPYDGKRTLLTAFG